MSRLLLSIPLLVLCCGCASAKSSFETVFSIPLPGEHELACLPTDFQGVNICPGLGHPRGSDMLYVATTAGVSAANLSSKTLAWTRNVEGTVEDAPLIYHDGTIFALAHRPHHVHHMPQQLFALDALTGAVKWNVTTDEWYSQVNYTIGNGLLALFSSVEVFVVNMTTGAKIWGHWGQHKILWTERPVVYYMNMDQVGAGAVDLFSGAVLWSHPSTHYFEMYYAFDEYTLLINGTDAFSNTSMIVYNAMTGEHVATIPNLGAPGVIGSGWAPTLEGTNLTFAAGPWYAPVYHQEAFVSFNVTTGEQLGGRRNVPSGIPPNQKFLHVASVQTADGTEIRVTGTLTIEVGPKGGPYVEVESFTPSADFNTHNNLQYWGHGVLQVRNLQGWTLWQIAGTKNATLLDRDEMSPGWHPSPFSSLVDGAAVFIESNAIKGIKLVA